MNEAMEKNFSILIIEDDYIDARFIDNVLVSSGFHTETAHNSQKAMSLLNAGNYDLALVDLKLADMDGIKILELIRRYYPAMEVIIITAHASIDTAVEAMRRGAYSYFIKGDPTRKLVADIKTIVSRKELQSTGGPMAKIENIHRLKARGMTFSLILSQAKMLAANGMNSLISGMTGTGRKALAYYMCHNGLHKNGPIHEIDFSKGGNEAVSAHQHAGTKYGLSIFLEKYGTNGTCLFLNIDQAPPEDLRQLLTDLEAHTLMRPADKPALSVISTCTSRAVLMLKATYGAKSFFRYWGVRVDLPEINERREDLPLIIDNYVQKACSEHQFPFPCVGVDRKLLEILSSSFFVGEFDGLEQLLRRLVKASSGNNLTPGLINQVHTEDILLAKGKLMLPTEPSSLKEGRDQYECNLIKTVYDRSGGNKTQTAKALGISSRQLYNMLKKYHLEKY